MSEPIDLLNDPDWPLAFSVAIEAAGWDVDYIAVAPDVWDLLEARVPAAPAASGLAALAAVRIQRVHELAAGDGFAVFRNGHVRRLFGKATTEGASRDKP